MTVYSKSEMISLASIVNSSPELPDLFYQTYDKIYEEQRHTSMSKELFFIFLNILDLSDQFIDSECRKVYHNIQYSSDSARQKRNVIYESDERFIKAHLDYFIGWGINKYSSPEKCLDYNISKSVEYYVRRSSLASFSAINEIVKIPLESMNEDQIIELLLLMKAPSRYDKYRHPEIFEKAFNELKEKVEKNGS